MDEALTYSQPRTKDRRERVRMGPTSTRTVRRPPLATYWLLADPGRRYVVYARGLTKALTLTLNAHHVGEYRVQRFNPRTGATRSLGEPRQLVSDFTWTPPDAGDWVLYLENTLVNSPAGH